MLAYGGIFDPTIYQREQMISFMKEAVLAIAELADKHLPILPGSIDFSVKARFFEGEWHITIVEDQGVSLGVPNSYSPRK